MENTGVSIEASNNLNLGGSSTSDQSDGNSGAKSSSNEIVDTSGAAQETFADPKLSEEELKKLGIDLAATQTKEFKINSVLLPIWKHLLTNGLKDQERSDLLLKYPRFSADCNLEAPKLNKEVVKIMNVNAKVRDGHFVDSQNVIGAALSALNDVISARLLDPNRSPDEIEKLGDIGKLLTHQHLAESKSRIAFISPGVAKEFKDVFEEQKPDEFLFGHDLKDKLNEAEKIQKTCLQLKNVPNFKKSYNKFSEPLNSKGSMGRSAPAFQSTSKFKMGRSNNFQKDNYHRSSSFQRDKTNSNYHRPSNNNRSRKGRENHRHRR